MRKTKRLEHELRDLEQRVKRDEQNTEEQLRREQQEINDLEHSVRAIKITQLGDDMPTNNTVAAGASGKFLATPVGGVFTSAPAWASDNPLAVGSVDPTDPTGATVNVAVDPTAPAGSSFNLTCTYTNPDGVVATPGTLNVAIGPAVTPPPADVTAINISQLS